MVSTARALSHELSNRLALVVGHLDLLVEDPDLSAASSASAQAAIESLQEAGEILHRLQQELHSAAAE